MTTSTTPASGAPAKLRRVLGLWDLIIIGIVIIQPIAPMGIYGVISNDARGHVVTTILIAMVAMLFTAVSYGKMARAYPSAGSAYTYVGQELNPALGYVTGWAIVMDYILNLHHHLQPAHSEYSSVPALLGARLFLCRSVHAAQ